MYQKIPEKMKKMHTWVCRKGKIPYNPHTGGKAITTQPTTWGSFDAAVAGAKKYNLDGIGFVFAEGWIGIDIDHCIQEGNISAFADEITRKFAGKAYIEISPSLNGLHIICPGTLPFSGRKNRKIGLEIYSKGRFFTITGKSVGKIDKFGDCQKEIDAVVKKYIPKAYEAYASTPAKPSSSSSGSGLNIIEQGQQIWGTKFLSLWDGDLSGHNNDHSAADLALCNYLAYLVSDPDDIDIYFRLSGLYRAKWERQDYRQATITKALENKSNLPITPHCSPSPSPSEVQGKAKSKNQAGGQIFAFRQFDFAVFEQFLLENKIVIRENKITGGREYAGFPLDYNINDNIVPIYLKELLLKDVEKKTGLTTQTVCEYIDLHCAKKINQYNPVMDYFDELDKKIGKIDGLNNFNELVQILGLKELDYIVMFLKSLLQFISLSLNPDENPYGADGVLVLQGKQRIGKTTLLQKLCPQREWFCEGASLNLQDKDSIIKVVKYPWVELGELDSTIFSRQDARLKAFLTDSVDEYRLPYARSYTTKIRRTSFFATVNSSDFLTDSTGSSRFWVVPLEAYDIDKLDNFLSEKKEKLWAEIYNYWKENGRQCFRLTKDMLVRLEERNQEYRYLLPAEQDLLDKLNFEQSYWVWYTVSEVKDKLFLNNDVRQIGKALTVIKNKEPKIEFKKIHGTRKWFLPKIGGR